MVLAAASSAATGLVLACGSSDPTDDPGVDLPQRHNDGGDAGTGADVIVTQPTIDSAIEQDALSGCTGVCVTKIVAGGDFVCTLATDDKVRCWGDNASGQIGPPIVGPVTAPKVIEGLGAVKDITAGNTHACALQKDGKLLCWGDDTYGLISGTATTTPHPAPHTMTGIPGTIDKLAGMSDHQCVITVARELYCWGHNEYGQCGVASTDGGEPPAIVPMPAQALIDVSQAGGSDDVTCALRQSGAVSCVGRNFSGQMGRGSSDFEPHAVPETVTGIVATVNQIAPGTGYHLAVALNDGRVQGWGSNATQAIVFDASVFEVDTATEVKGAANILEVAAGAYFSCARNSTGDVFCWGDDTEGQGGVVEAGVLAAPTQVAGLTNVTRVAAGRGGFACAVTGGKVMCWGINDKGQLGRGTVSDPQATPGPATL